MTVTKTVKMDILCRTIMSADRNVRSVAILDKKRRLVHSESRRGFVHSDLDKWNDPHYMECTFDVSLGKKFDELYGPIRYHHSVKDDLIMFSFPYEENVIIATSTKKISPISFATKIAFLINNRFRNITPR